MIPRAAILIGVAALASHGAFAQQPKSFSSEVLKEVTAEVESVDHEDRTLVLRGEDDARTLIVAGPQVRNLEQINEGDRVVASYRVALAADVKPKGEGVEGVKKATATARAPEGAQPAKGVGSTIATTVSIDSVDTSFDTVTFTRPDGITRTVAVEDPGAQAFIRELKRGDEVQVMYTEAVAVNVRPAQ
jgi:hypothetical protein